MEPERKRYRTYNILESTFHRMALLKLRMEITEHRAITQDEFLVALLDRMESSLAEPTRVADFA